MLNLFLTSVSEIVCVSDTYNMKSYK